MVEVATMEIIHAIINGIKHSCEVSPESTTKSIVRAESLTGGASHTVEFVQGTLHRGAGHGDCAASTVSFFLDGKRIAAHVYEKVLQGTTTYYVWIHGVCSVFEITHAGTKRCAGGAPLSVFNNPVDAIIPARQACGSVQDFGEDDRSVMRSPLAGLVVKICVKPGQRVLKNDPLFVVESMKMENEINASFDAVIKTISINEGNLVQPNEVVIMFEK